MKFLRIREACVCWLLLGSSCSTISRRITVPELPLFLPTLCTAIASDRPNLLSSQGDHELSREWIIGYTKSQQRLLSYIATRIWKRWFVTMAVLEGQMRSGWRRSSSRSGRSRSTRSYCQRITVRGGLGEMPYYKRRFRVAAACSYSLGHTRIHRQTGIQDYRRGAESGRIPAAGNERLLLLKPIACSPNVASQRWRNPQSVTGSSFEWCPFNARYGNIQLVNRSLDNRSFSQTIPESITPRCVISSS